MNVEEILSRELTEVADGLHIPPMPLLPEEPPHRDRHWLALLVAAAVLLVIAGGVTVVALNDGDTSTPQPAPQPTQTPSVPTPTGPSVNSPEEPAGPIPTSAPSVPYVVDQHLYVDGEQVPGTWWQVWHGGAAWLAIRTDGTWWWGWSPEPVAINGGQDDVPSISPNGKYIAQTLRSNGKGTLTGFDTRPDGEGLGRTPLDLGDPEAGTTVYVKAVTDDGQVIAQGGDTSVMWLPLGGGKTVDLSSTAPGQVVWASTSAGLVVSDGESGPPYLAEISDDGMLTRVAALSSTQVTADPSATWLLWPGLPTEGDVTSIPTLKAQSLDGSQQATLDAPHGWEFKVRTWAWEDDDLVVSTVVGDRGERLARCSVTAAECVLIRSR
jgi:hypothetical protein